MIDRCFTQSMAKGAHPEEWRQLSSNLQMLPDLLPVVCDLAVPISKGSMLKKLGKVPSLVSGDGSARGIRNWQVGVTRGTDIETWIADGRLGICLRMRNHKVFDIDVEDQDLSDRIKGMLIPMVADLSGVQHHCVPLRFRNNSNKFAVLVSCDASMRKRDICFGEKGRLELLGNAQHAVIFGTHPSGARIQWVGDPVSPPKITNEQVDAIWQTLIAEFGQFVSGRSINAQSNHADHEDFMAGREPILGLSEYQIKEALEKLSPDLPRGEWIKVGMALHHECGGSDLGLSFWDEWSSNGASYPGVEDLRVQWESFSIRAGRASITMATALKMANEVGLAFGPPIVAGRGPGTKRGQSIIKFPPPFRGFMAAAVDAALQSAIKPQPDLTCLGVLTAMAAACPGKVQLPDGGCLNLYALCVSPSASGKDHVQHTCREIARLGNAKVLGEIVSIAGIEDSLSDYRNMLSTVDEIAHVFASRTVQNNQHTRDVEKALLRLFSASGNTYSTRLKAGRNSRTVEHPCLSLLGFAVPEKLGEALSRDDVASGLLNRMLIAVGDGKVAPSCTERRKFHLDEEIRRNLEEVVRLCGHKEVTLSLAADAQAKVTEMQLQLHKEAQRLPEEAGERLLLGRTMEKAIRIAGVLAFFEKPSDPVIEVEHLDWGVQFAKASDATLLRFLREHMHGGQVQRNAAKVIQAMQSLLDAGGPASARKNEIKALEQGFVPMSLLVKRMRLSSKEVSDAIDHLKVCGDVMRTTLELDRSSRIEVVGFID